ncbi:MAG: MarR family transcriptional regulator [Sphingomonadales bacterium]|nr:MarR family transcriptional regulator [Sphingomonadales bacterium]
MILQRSDLESRYARTLLPLARLWRQAADRALDRIGLSAGAGWALVQIGRMGDDVRQTDLARELDVSAAALVRLLDGMVAAGQVERRRDAVDSRVSRVSLTVPGRALATQAEQVLHALRHDILSGESDADLAVALGVAERLRARIAGRRGP